MIFGSFRESKPESEDWGVSLSNDNLDPLEILPHIIHANFPLVPGLPALPVLYEVFLISNKYDMVLALKPWAVLWLGVVESFVEATDGLSVAVLAYITWGLGRVVLHK
ncbi:nuclear pore protein [Colletotrichum tabaci]|uniref:Nuclear pore protein n=1 Tax=Colletotrichum tabaci TaxID=1209068 RepID=A0AAV9T963_9PEZI